MCFTIPSAPRQSQCMSTLPPVKVYTLDTPAKIRCIAINPIIHSVNDPVIVPLPREHSRMKATTQTSGNKSSINDPSVTAITVESLIAEAIQSTSPVTMRSSHFQLPLDLSSTSRKDNGAPFSSASTVKP